MRRKATTLVFGFLWSLLSLVTLAGAQPLLPDHQPPAWAILDRPSDAPLSVPAFDKLHSNVQQKGAVRVIVRMRDPVGQPQGFRPDGALDANAQRMQRAAIKRLQDGLNQRLPSGAAAKAKRMAHIPFMALEVDQAGFTALLNSPEVDLIEEDVPTAPMLSQSVPLIGADGSGTFAGFTGAGQTVAILDTGVDKTHPFLSGKVVDEACYSTTYSAYASTSVCPNGQNSQTGSGAGVNCNSSIGGCDHGTHVAGIAAGNGAGFSGVAKDATIIAIQVFTRFDSAASCGSAPVPCALSYTSDQISALDRVYALKDTYNISSVNMSLGGGSYTANCNASNTSEKAAIDNLRSAGIATIIASGNNGYTDSISSPACISTAVSVGATTKSNVVASYSNSASILNLLAPGSSIYSSTPGGNYAAWNGTSMATPHVTGAWAVMKSKNPAATVDEILNAFASTGFSITDTRNGITKPRISVTSALGAISTAGMSATLTPSVASPQHFGTSITFTASGSGGAGSYEYEFYLQSPSSSTWVKQQAYSGTNTWTWNTAGLSAGTYKIRLWLRNAGTSPAAGYDALQSINFTLSTPSAATGVTLTPSVASPQNVGTSVTFTAAGAGSSGSYEYEFYLQSPGSTAWVKKQAFSSTATWAWSTAGLTAGTYQLCVWARAAGTTPTNGSYDASAVISYTLNPVTTTGLTVTPSVASPQNIGTSVTFTAAASGGNGSYDYEFYLQSPGSTAWVKKQAYSSTATLAWSTTGLAAGTYQLNVWARTSGTTPANGSYDISKTISFTLNPVTATGLTVTPSVASPQSIGTSVTFTAAGSGGNGSYDYEFYLQSPGSTAWVKKQAYSSTATWAWSTAGLAAGTYQLNVWAKTSGTTPANGSYDIGKTISFTLNPVTTTGLTATPSVASPQSIGTGVTFTAAGSGGNGSYDYEFYLQSPGSTAWVKKQAYSSTATWAWNTTGLASGSYQVSVWAKTSGTSPTNGSYDVSTTVSYTLNAVSTTGLTVTPSVASPQSIGTSVTFTAAGSGGNGSYDYEFYLQSPGSTAWVKKQAYSSTATWAWNTTGLAAGTYQLSVWAKTTGTTPANGSYDVSKTISYTLSSVATTGLTVTPSVASPQSIGTNVTFTAAGSGGNGSYDYEFYLQSPGSTAWVKKQAYSSTATWAWNTTGLAAGTYQLSVWTKTTGTTPANGSYDFSKTISYTINSVATTGLTVTPSVASPQNIGTSVTFTAAGSGGNGSYDYEFYLLAPGTTTWVKKQAYSSTATWTWNTTGLTAGTYQLSVWTRTTGTTPANGSYDISKTISYTINSIAASGLTVTPSVATPQPVGTGVTFTAAGSGGNGSYDYEFYLLAPGSTTWVKKQAYSSTATWAWNTTGLVSGTYQVCVWVRTTGTTPVNGLYDKSVAISYVLNPLPATTGLTVTPSVASPQTIGTNVTFTAAGSGGTGSYEYEFYLLAPGSTTWVKKQAYSGTATWAWNTTGLAAGTYQICVWVRTAGTTPSSYDKYTVASYTLQ